MKQLIGALDDLNYVDQDGGGSGDYDGADEDGSETRSSFELEMLKEKPEVRKEKVKMRLLNESQKYY